MITASPQWLLLDVPGAPLAAAILRQTFGHVRWFWLFEETELHASREQGPVLVELGSCPALTELCYGQAQDWRGLLVFSGVSPSSLLVHLRRMLTVSVGLHHRALLNYYNPNTASYFFDACDARELSRWLGPISQLHWFGGTWADRAIGCQSWQQLHNPGLAVSPLAVEESLSPGQQGKLQTCLLEQHAWHWSQSTGTDYHSLWAHMQDGLALGFNERAVLDDWLWLRLQYPRAALVLPLSGQTQRERLDRLRDRWQAGQR